MTEITIRKAILNDADSLTSLVREPGMFQHPVEQPPDAINFLYRLPEETKP